MTFSKLFSHGIFLAVIVSAVKIFFIRSFNWEEFGSIHVFFWILLFIFSTFFARRLGVITYLEAIVTSVVWLFLIVVLDLSITGIILGYGILLDVNFLLGYLVVVLGIFLFHKKRHVHLRKQLAAKGGHH